MVKSTISSAKEEKNLLSVYFRILMNHMQLLFLTASFDLNWPAMVIKFFESAAPVAEQSSQIFSFDCFIDLRENAFDMNHIRLIYLKVIMMGSLPPLILFISLLVWTFIYRKKPRLPETIED